MILDAGIGLAPVPAFICKGYNTKGKAMDESNDTFYDTDGFTGPRTLGELGFDRPYRAGQFKQKKYTSNRCGVLEHRLCIAYYAMAVTPWKDGITREAPICTTNPVLVEKLGGKKNVQRAVRWLVDSGFLKVADHGFYLVGSRARRFYVNHAAIKCWVSALKELGILPRKYSIKWFGLTERERVKAMASIEKKAAKYKSVSEWKKKADSVEMFKKCHIPLVRKYGITHTQMRAYICHKAIANTPIYTCTQALVHTQVCGVAAEEEEGKSLSHMGTLRDADYGEFESESPKIAHFGPLDNSRSLDLLSDILHPHVHVHGGFVTGISYRVYSKIALLKNKGGDTSRKDALDGIFGKGNWYCHDEHASIHHQTRCLNDGIWYDNGFMDIYGSIHKAVYGCEMGTDRPEHKLNLNRVAFEHSARSYAAHRMRSEGSTGDERRFDLIDEYERLMGAYEGVCGKPVGKAIFAIESLFMVQLQVNLLERGILSANVYDALYMSRCGRYSDEELEEIVRVESRRAWYDAVLPFRDTYSREAVA